MTRRTALALIGAMSLAGCRKENVPHEHEAPAPPAKVDVAACNAMFDGAQRELVAALPSDRSCRANDDCEIVYTTVCNSDCGTVSIPKPAVSAVEAKRRAIEATTCKKYQDADCPHITPRAMASCAVPSAACKKGSCGLEPWKPP